MAGGFLLDRVVTQRYNCGPYYFYSSVPRIGPERVEPLWSASFKGMDVKGAFQSLEDAMRAAINFRHEVVEEMDKSTLMGQPRDLD